MSDNKDTIETLQDNTRAIPDISDRASEETDRALELRTRDRQRKLVAKIDSALRRIEEGEYGYCEETGEPISLRRLDARPIATMSLEAQERHERREKVHRDDWLLIWFLQKVTLWGAFFAYASNWTQTGTWSEGFS